MTAHVVSELLPANAKEVFADAWRRLAKEIADAGSDEESMQRVEVSLPCFPPLAWLAAQQQYGRYYWRSRDGAYETAGVGEADIYGLERLDTPVSVLKTLRKRLGDTHPDLRYFGGFRFHARPEHDGRWHDFKACRFVVPRLEVVRKDSNFFLAYNFTGADSPSQRVENGLNPTAAWSSVSTGLPPMGKRTDLPDYAGWELLVDRALHDCNAGRLQKVVLARQTMLHAEAELDPARLLRVLAPRAEGTFLFCFQPSAKRAFLGASPERLFFRCGRHVVTEALAGTRPRGTTREEDGRLARELLESDKEWREHAVVVDEIRAILERYCSALSYTVTPEIKKLHGCLHLYTEIEGELRPEIDDDALLNALHPTPAVGGRPRQEALEWIEREEPFDRGVYAAPVGWVGVDATEFCVGIRSALVRGSSLTLFAGAGIVAGSDAQEEWREVEAKLSTFLDAIRESESHA